MNLNLDKKTGRNIIAAALALSPLVTVAFNLYTHHLATEHMKGLALDAARSYSQMIVAFRNWNADHGGFYVRVSDDVQPNPYLDPEGRDFRTSEGVEITKLNPSYMTRLLSEYLGKNANVYFHMSSLQPINPDNTPDPWEAGALKAFGEGLTEEYRLRQSSSGTTYLDYIAPLRVEGSCLQCHRDQGYSPGDVIGGVTVSMDYGPYLTVHQESTRRVFLLGLVFLLSMVAILGVLGRRLTVWEHKLGMLAQAVQQSGDAVMITDSEGRIEFVNHQFETTTGLSRDEVIGKTPRILKSGEQSDSFYRELWSTITSGRTWSSEFVNRKKDGSLWWANSSIAPVMAGGRITNFVAVIRDITFRKEAEMEKNRLIESLEESNRQLTKYRELLENLARTDELTGLLNRRGIMETLGREISRSERSGTPLSAMIMDIDGFKGINDTHGHVVGDEVLRRVGEAIRSSIRNMDIAGRYGGDEFLIVLPQTDAARASAVAERVRDSIGRVEVEVPAGEGIKLTASVGVCDTLLSPGEDRERTLIHRADLALYEAKRAGGNQVRVCC